MQIKPSFVDQCIKETIQREGGVTQHPADRGGLTKYGITKKSLCTYQNLPIEDITDLDIHNLSVGLAFDIYKHDYVIKYGLDQVGWNLVFDIVLDMAVLHGPKRSIKILQKTLGIEADGIIGPITINALEAFVPEKYEKIKQLRIAICRERIRYLVKIVQNDPTQIVFLLGWLYRALEFYTWED